MTLTEDRGVEREDDWSVGKGEHVTCPKKTIPDGLCRDRKVT